MILHFQYKVYKQQKTTEQVVYLVNIISYWPLGLVAASEVIYLVNIILAFRISSCQYSTASVELADKPCLGNTDCLLFHCLVNTCPVMLTYTVEFINATQAAVGKDESTCFKLPFTAILHTAMTITELTSTYQPSHEMTSRSECFNFITFISRLQITANCASFKSFIWCFNFIWHSNQCIQNCTRSYTCPLQTFHQVYLPLLNYKRVLSTQRKLTDQSSARCGLLQTELHYNCHNKLHLVHV